MNIKPQDVAALAAAYGFDNYKDPDKRDFLATCMVGDKAQGKTSLMRLYAQHYEAQMNLLFSQGKLERPRKVLIWDSVKSPTFDIFEEITPDELKYGFPTDDPNKRRYWTKGIRRMVRTWRDKKDDEKALIIIQDYFKNGLLVADEIHDWLHDSNPPPWQTDLIRKHRNYGNDVLFGTQNLMDLPIDARPHFWRYIFFKTPEYITKPDWFGVRRFPQPEKIYKVWREAYMLPEIPNSKIQPFTVYEKSYTIEP